MNCTVKSMRARYCTLEDYGLRKFVYGVKCKWSGTEADKLNALI